jgi:U3 small nucleolar ribonucleoprotein component
MWKENNRKIEVSAPGVYLLKGLIDIPLQIVVSKDLPDDDFRALRIMTPDANEEEVRKFLTEASKYTEPGDRQDANAVLMVSSLANEDMYNRLYEEDEDMRNVLKELMKDEFEETKKNSYDFGYNSGFDKGEKLGFEKGTLEERQKNEARISALEAEIKRLQQLIPTEE